MKKMIFIIFLSLFFVSNIFSFSFRVSQIPNGNRFSCANCHVSPFGGGPRNAFGQLVEQKYLDQSGNVTWNSSIANEDADGDGFSNGQELQDPNGTWRIGQADPGIAANVTNPGDRNSKPVGTSVEELAMITTYNLEQNYPNPFNPETVISYSIPNVMLRQANHDNSGVTLSLSKSDILVTLKVYDILGNEVATLVNEYQKPGYYNYKFSIGNYQLSSGVYFYQLNAGDFIQTRKMILMK